MSLKNASPPPPTLKNPSPPLPTRKSDLLGGFLYKVYNLVYEVLFPHYPETSTSIFGPLILIHHKATSGRSLGAIIYIYVT